MTTLHPSPAPLRIGILIDDFELRAWQYELLEQMQQADWLDVALVVKRESATQPKQTFSQRLANLRKHFLLAFYTRFDEAWFRRRCVPNAFAAKCSKSMIGLTTCLILSFLRPMASCL